MQADASGLLASQLNEENACLRTRIWFNDRPLDHILSGTTYDTLALGSKTIWVTALNQKALTNLLPKKLNSCDQGWSRVSPGP